MHFYGNLKMQVDYQYVEAYMEQFAELGCVC